jgi:hypothetical protein
MLLLMMLNEYDGDIFVDDDDDDDDDSDDVE